MRIVFNTLASFLLINLQNIDWGHFKLSCLPQTILYFLNKVFERVPYDLREFWKDLNVSFVFPEREKKGGEGIKTFTFYSSVYKKQEYRAGLVYKLEVSV